MPPSNRPKPKNWFPQPQKSKILHITEQEVTIDRETFNLPPITQFSPPTPTTPSSSESSLPISTTPKSPHSRHRHSHTTRSPSLRSPSLRSPSPHTRPPPQSPVSPVPSHPSHPPSNPLRRAYPISPSEFREASIKAGCPPRPAKPKRRIPATTNDSLPVPSPAAAASPSPSGRPRSNSGRTERHHRRTADRAMRDPHLP